MQLFNKKTFTTLFSFVISFWGPAEVLTTVTAVLLCAAAVLPAADSVLP